MRILAGLGIATVVLLVGALLLADLIVTRIVNREPWRSRIDAEVDAALGRDASWSGLGLALLPPSLVIEDAAIEGAPDAVSPFLTAGAIEVRAQLPPLLAGALVLDSLLIREATLHLDLEDDGLVLPELGEDQPDARSEPEPAEGGPAQVAIRRVELEDARLVFRDRTLSPPRGFELVDIDARLEGTGLREPFSVDVSIEADGGGRVTVRGSADLDAELDLTVELEDFPLLPLDPYLEAADELEGRVTGTMTIVGPVGAPSRVAATLEVADARLRFQDTVVEGPLSWQLEHSGPWGEPRGSFRIDATRARASLAGVYEKAPGRPATVTGRLVSKDGVIGFDDVKLKVENAEARGRVDFDERMHALIAVDPVELGHWQPLLTPLREFELSGAVASERWEVWSQPLAMRGRLAFDRVRLAGPAGRSFVAEGVAVAGDGVIRSEDLVLETAGERLPVELEITELDGDWRYRVRAAGSQMDSNELLTGIAGRPDTLYGLLDFDGDLTGTLAGAAGFLRTLGGRTRFRVAPGKLKGISILEATLTQFDQIGAGGPLERLLRPRGGLAPRMRQYYKDDFLQLGASLVLDRGVASTKDLRLRTDTYEFTMQGRIDLADLGLDAQGEITLGQELMQEIARSVGLERIPLLQPIVVPIPRLRGTVTDPKPEPDFGFLVRALTGNLPGAKGVQKLIDGLRPKRTTRP